MVLIDDLDYQHVGWIGPYIKIWADRYGMQVESKGGHIRPQHDVLVVTSNYSIVQLFGPSEFDSEQQKQNKQLLCRAIEDRFHVIV